ncbi:UPF0193 protein EVG1%2C partial [Scomber scombrus]|uniref:UPF0193 protein EVG1, partial n=1 Tax=Scomber scombrus TaxID=13677 RepID=A0AAV1NUC1_SCOSC|nr:UPF0193 protein EVG1 [Scomber scombrus]
MEPSSQSRVTGGLWNNPRPPQYSKETQDMMKIMMQESKLTNLHRKQINECLKNGTALPPPSDPTQSASPPQPKTRKSLQKCLPNKPLRRSADSCRSGNNYVREKFRPGPIRDLEKEKRRLQNILATGQEEPTAASCQNDTAEVIVERDKYQEVLDEIAERRQFLEDMASLGQEKQYIQIINTEISQKIRELEVLDKTRSRQKEAVTSERRAERTEQITEKKKQKETDCC